MNEILKEFNEKIIEKMKNKEFINSISFVFNKSKEYDKYRPIITKYIQDNNLSGIIEYLYIILNNLEMPNKCIICNKKALFTKYGKGYWKTCGSNLCISKIRSKNRKNIKMSQETKNKISIAHKGIPKSKQTIDKIKNTKKMYPCVMSRDTRNKMSYSQKKRLEDPKQKEVVLKNLKNAIEKSKTPKAKEKRIKTLIERYGVTNPGRLAKIEKYSKISQEFFNILKNKLNLSHKECFYATNNGEKRLEFANNLVYKPDFLYKNFIIEFYGDIYHANPNLFSETDTPNFHFPELTSKDLWDKDSFRQQIFEENGYKVIVVWENDYKTNKEKIINDILQELKNV